MDVCLSLYHLHHAYTSCIHLFLIFGSILVLTVVVTVGPARRRGVVRIRRQGIAQSRFFVRSGIQTNQPTLFESVVGFGALHVIGCGFGRRIRASDGASFVRVGTGRSKGGHAAAARATTASSIVGAATTNTTVAASIVGRSDARATLTTRNVRIAITAIARSRMLLDRATALSARTTTGMIAVIADKILLLQDPSHCGTRCGRGGAIQKGATRIGLYQGGGDIIMVVRSSRRNGDTKGQRK